MRKLPILAVLLILVLEAFAPASSIGACDVIVDTLMQNAVKYLPGSSAVTVTILGLGLYIVRQLAELTVSGSAIQNDADRVACNANGVKVVGWGLGTYTSVVDFVRVGDVSLDRTGGNISVRLVSNTGPKVQQIETIGPQRDGDSKVNPPEVSVEFIEGIRIWID